MSRLLASTVAAHAAGALAAQRFIQELREDRAIPIEAVDRLRTVMVEHGTESPAVGGFLAELAKRAR